MKKFSSYGPIDKDIHYYVPRAEQIQSACHQLVGEIPEKGGHYITVWAPRQCGKTWIMREAAETIDEQGQFEVAIISMQSAKTVTTDEGILELFVERLEGRLGRDLKKITEWKDLHHLFSRSFFKKPLILIIDEFDAVHESFIDKFSNEFRDIYISRQMENRLPSPEKKCLLHGLALIGVRSVLGIENVTGSPFNVQRSLYIPNLTSEEVHFMFQWYEKESGQAVEPEVMQRVYDETRGQPGLVSWFGELLTEGYDGYEPDGKHPITVDIFENIFADAVDVLPNNTILNIISKAKQATYKETVLGLFRTRDKMPFHFDDPRINFLYMNGVIDREKTGSAKNTVRFSSPFVQKRVFNYFAGEIFQTIDHLYDPMTDIEAVLETEEIQIPELMNLYQIWLTRNRGWLLKDAPRRKTDLRIYEAVFHFNLYMYLKFFFQDKGGNVFPEFPTGNGKVDILIRYGEKRYALELKSFKDRYAYKQALSQAAAYAVHLKLGCIFLIFFIECIDDENRRQLEVIYRDEKTGVIVEPIFLETGNASGN